MMLMVVRMVIPVVSEVAAADVLGEGNSTDGFRIGYNLEIHLWKGESVSTSVMLHYQRLT